MEIVSEWIIWGYPDFRTQIILFSGHSRLNPNYIIDKYHFSALDVLIAAHPVWSRLWSLCHHLSVQRLAKFLRSLRWIAIKKISNCWDPNAQAEVVLFSQQWPLINGLNHTAAWITINRKWECNGNNIKILQRNSKWIQKQVRHSSKNKSTIWEIPVERFLTKS